jgi:hypothetical protein
MSIEGVKFCDVCGGAIGVYDVAPVKVDDDGHMLQLHLHNRHSNDCLAQKLIELAEEYANKTLAMLSDGIPQQPVEREA